ncbi:MAG: phenylacetate--CoA ligase family protein [Chromatiales bacterium]|nr:MAG: phenylacetate--CoA ligase family protein [Chromatiales bacterium]
MIPGSAIHAAPEDWAAQLRDRALAGPRAHDLPAILDAFRQHSDYYRARIGDADWPGVPVLEKADVADVPVGDAPDLKASRTSGTSGFQVTIRNTAREREFRRALLYRPQLFYGLPAEVNQVVFVDGAWCAGPADAPKWFSYGGTTYRTWFCGVAGDPREIWQLLITLRPQLVRGIASGIVRFVETVDAPLKDIGVRIVAPGGESLLPEWRRTIEAAFRARVLDRYGSTETGAIAWQCPDCGRYHANADEIVLEDAADGLVATPLFVSSQPLLRYRLGDRVRFDAGISDCPIGLPTLTIAQARRDDWLVDGNGQRVSPLAFQFEQVPGLRAWRLHQRSDGVLTLYFDADAPSEAAPALLAAVQATVPGRRCELVQGLWQVPATDGFSSKFKRVSSELAGRTNPSA